MSGFRRLLRCDRGRWNHSILRNGRELNKWLTSPPIDARLRDGFGKSVRLLRLVKVALMDTAPRADRSIRSMRSRTRFSGNLADLRTLISQWSLRNLPHCVLVRD